MTSLKVSPLFPEYKQFALTTEDAPVTWMPPLFAPAQLSTILQPYIDTVEDELMYIPPPEASPS
jgi:hypothetical protein